MVLGKRLLILCLLSTATLPLVGQCAVSSAEILKEGKVRTFKVQFDTLTPYRSMKAREVQHSEFIIRSVTNQSEGWVWVSSKYGMDCVVGELVRWTGCRDEREASR